MGKQSCRHVPHGFTLFSYLRFNSKVIILRSYTAKEMLTIARKLEEIKVYFSVRYICRNYDFIVIFKS